MLTLAETYSYEDEPLSKTHAHLGYSETPQCCVEGESGIRNRFAQFRVAVGKHGGKESPLPAKKRKGEGNAPHYLDTGRSQKRYREGVN
jgi:hypothetical protein